MGLRLILAVALGALVLPAAPADNPMSEVKVRLGRYLFYDARLSVNGKESCASCHKQELAFTDGRAVAVGTTGQPHPRGAMSLVNVAYNATLTWSDPRLHSLEKQAFVPLLSKDPVEMGMGGHEQAVIAYLREEAIYRELFPQAFPQERDPFTLANPAEALAAFERTPSFRRALRMIATTAMASATRHPRIRQARRSALLQRAARRLLPMPQRREFHRWRVPQYRTL